MTTHEIDPDGDVILVFKNPRPSFDVDDDLNDYDVGDDLDDYSIEAVDHAPKEAEPRPESLGPQAEPTIVEIRVSSSHLMLSSPYFKRALKGDWKEGNALRTDKYVRMDQKDGDAEATLILMNIIHARNHSVPKTLSLEMLARMTVLVDLYECWEPVQIFSDMWIGYLESSMPTTLTKTLVMWISISSVFYKPKVFKTMTHLALQYSKGPIKTFGLPIMSRVIDDIEQRRQESIEALIKELHKLVDKLLEDYIGLGCSSECRAALLGGLAKDMHAQKLFRPIPTTLLLGFKFFALVKSVRNMQGVTWSLLELKGGYRLDHSQHHCTMKVKLEGIIKYLEPRMRGLEISSYVRWTDGKKIPL